MLDYLQIISQYKPADGLCVATSLTADTHPESGIRMMYKIYKFRLTDAPPSIHLRRLLSHSELEVVVDSILHHSLKFVNRLTTRIAQQLLDVRHAVGLSSEHPSSSTLPQH